MNIADLTPIPDNIPIWLWGKTLPRRKLKIYHDGSHHVGTLVVRSRCVKRVVDHEVNAMDILFDSLYFNAIKANLPRNERDSYIKDGILKLYPNAKKIDDYISEKVERKIKNLYKRKKRFQRKANLNDWNYFVTITCNDSLHTEESFRKKLRRCLSNLHTRRGWRYMGVFECAPKTGRMHFHAFMYVPCGEMIGKLAIKKDYDIKNKKMQTTVENSFFACAFGRNDFEKLNKMELKKGYSTDYITKYMGKTNERFVYSRGIPTEIFLEIDDEDIATEMLDFVTKYILYDDVVDWERDIARVKYKQVNLIDILCNP